MQPSNHPRPVMDVTAPQRPAASVTTPPPQAEPVTPPKPEPISEVPQSMPVQQAPSQEDPTEAPEQQLQQEDDVATDSPRDSDAVEQEAQKLQPKTPRPKDATPPPVGAIVMTILCMIALSVIAVMIYLRHSKLS